MNLKLKYYAIDKLTTVQKSTWKNAKKMVGIIYKSSVLVKTKFDCTSAGILTVNSD